MSVKASVIIPTYDDWTVLQTCLDCLAAQSVSLDLFEVLIANNNASPTVPAGLKLPPNARVLHAPKPGSYAARNAALREAKGGVLFFTDSDCQPDRLWIENGLAELAKLGPIDRIAGEVALFPSGPTWTGPELYDRTHYLRQDDYVTVGWCVTANLVTSRAAFDRVGPFSEDRFSGGDGEWGMRATALGSRIVHAPSVMIRHPARTDMKSIAMKERRKAGAIHQKEVIQGRKARATLSFLIPPLEAIQRIQRDGRLSDGEKLRVFWLQMRMSLVMFREIVRLRYLSGAPRRS
jgi:glycosyltransferase involved in cell wall biosynthesis